MPIHFSAICMSDLFVELAVHQADRSGRAF
jgi:hypothetical protein